jgi:hypothetical protein
MFASVLLALTWVVQTQATGAVAKYRWLGASLLHHAAMRASIVQGTNVWMIRCRYGASLTLETSGMYGPLLGNWPASAS